MSRQHQRTSIAYLNSTATALPSIDALDRTQRQQQQQQQQQQQKPSQNQHQYQHLLKLPSPMTALGPHGPAQDQSQSIALPPLSTVQQPRIDSADGPVAASTFGFIGHNHNEDYAAVAGSSTSGSNSNAGGGASAAGSQSAKRKKRKTNRACNHCQKSHLTCDDSRPCARCVKRGIANTCVDGVRKKAKYLLGIDECASQEDHDADADCQSLVDAQNPAAADLTSASASAYAEADADAGASATDTAPLATGEPALPSIQAPLLEQQRQRQQQQQQQQQQFQAIAQMAAFSQPSPSPGVVAGGISSISTISAPAPVDTASAAVNASASAPAGVVSAAGLQATPTAVNFGSEAINLEYAFLSSMFSYPMFNNASAMSASSDAADLATATNGQQQPMLAANSTISIPNSLWAPPPPSAPSLVHAQSHTQLHTQAPTHSQTHSQTQLPSLLSTTQPRLPQRRTQMAAASPPSLSSVASMMPRQESWQGQGQSLVQHENQALVPTANGTSVHSTQQQHFAGATPLVQPSPPPHAQIVGDDTHNPLSRPPTSGPAVYGLNPVYPQSPAQVYSSVTEPYKYYNGFHFFFRHICGRMGKKDIMRISRAIAHFRPSLVAQLRNLTYDDLVFMEKSFQRALMEYEKLIGFIGTPTVVWRRSGEIALVGKEFSILTQWDRQLLMAGNRFIFELMDTSSAVVYWERFAEHAFENSEHSVMSDCRLVRPDGVAVPCAFSFTIKRDLFGIPMAIIGNFLPIL